MSHLVALDPVDHVRTTFEELEILDIFRYDGGHQDHHLKTGPEDSHVMRGEEEPPTVGVPPDTRVVKVGFVQGGDDAAADKP